MAYHDKSLLTEKFLIEEIQSLLNPNHLIMLNDNDTTFDSVIVALMDVCDHTHQQAEQCSVITHHKGKCIVKKGSYGELKAMKDALSDRGIGASIE